MTATDELRRLLDGRGVKWEDMSDFGVAATEWWSDDGSPCTALESDERPLLGVPDGKLSVEASITPEQAIEATLGHAYEPPLAAHWDGDTLTLTIPRDPSCIRVQRSAEQPCKVYADESKAIAATLGKGECRKLPPSGDAVCIVRRHGYEMEFGYWRCSECGCECFEGARYCMGCGRKVRA